MKRIRPFIRYYGGKWRTAPSYPSPKHNTIVEPFAGAAGYSLLYSDRDVILIEKYAVLAEMWRYLISVDSYEIMAIPTVEHVNDLPSWVPQGGRTLVGFAMNAACVSPCKSLSAGRKRSIERGRKYEGWSSQLRIEVADNVNRIRHWKVIEGDYTLAPDIEATWFVDPPYNNRAGSYYIHSDLDYVSLGSWCRGLPGQVIVCENEGADWLPFKPFKKIKAMSRPNGKSFSAEVIWTNDAVKLLDVM